MHEVCYRDMELVAASTALRFRFLATALVDHDQSLREAMASVYRDLTATWTRVCTTAVTTRGLALRSGITFEELTTVLIALAEGLALRMVADPGTAVSDPRHRRTLLGKAALAMFVGSVDPGDGTSLEQAADEIASSRGSRPDHSSG